MGINRGSKNVEALGHAILEWAWLTRYIKSVPGGESPGGADLVMPVVKVRGQGSAPCSDLSPAIVRAPD